MPPRPLRLLLLAGALFICTNGPVLFVRFRWLDGTYGWEEPFTRQIFVALAAAAVVAVALDGQRPDARRLTRPPRTAAIAVVGFAVWNVLTSLWSVAPDITRGRALIYVGLAALAWLLADLDDHERHVVLTLTTGAGVGLSVVALLASDVVGVDFNDDWRGIYTNRNSLAPVTAIFVLAAAGWVARTSGRRRIGALVAVVLGLVVLAGTGSRTAWLALAVAVGATAVILIGRRGWRTRGRGGLVVPAVVAIAGLTVLVGVLSSMWDEKTFAQRRTIWSEVWDQIGERPVHGHGWFTIWTDAEFVARHELLERGSAHDSALEVWLGAGLIGLVGFVVIAGLALRSAVGGAWRGPTPAAVTWLAIVIFLLVENLTESFVLWFSYNWVLLMAAALRPGGERRWSPADRTRAPTAAATGSRDPAPASR